MIRTLLILALLSSGAAALERSSIGDDYQSSEATSMRVQAVTNLVSSTVASIARCSTKDMRYSPNSAARDADGCIDTPVSTCAKQNRVYMPNNAGSNAQGCFPLPTSGLPTCLKGYRLKSTAPGSWSCWKQPQNFSIGANCGGTSCSADAATLNKLCNMNDFSSYISFTSGSSGCTWCTYSQWTGGGWTSFNRCTTCSPVTSVYCQ